MQLKSLLFCLALCVPLAACAGANAALQTPEAEPMAAAPSARPPGHNAMAAAKKDDKKDKKKDEQKEDWWQEGGVTREKINAMCWMKYENGRRDMPVEKRADLVDACVQQTLKDHPLR
jgi:hypothetical protein